MDSYRSNALYRYWRRVHRQALSNGADVRQAVCIPEGVFWENILTDLAHRLGMIKAFRRMGDLTHKKVLDIGCGRGRWTRQFADRGADVLGVDWSPEAIEANRAAMPWIRFECLSVLDLNRIPSETYDLVNSVTVIQHTPHEAHEEIIRQIHRILVKGGRLCLLESIYNPLWPRRSEYRDGPATFYHTRDQWQGLGELCGFVTVYVSGCSYRLLMRLSERLPMSGRRWFRNVIGLPSVPLEVVSAVLPLRLATHAAYLFEKP